MSNPDASPPSPAPRDSGAPPVRILALDSMGCFDWDVPGHRLHLDETALRIFGMRADDYDGRPENLSALIPPDEERRLLDVIAEAFRSGADNYSAYFRVRSRDGGLRWAHTHGCVLRNEEGRAQRVFGLFRNTTEELSEAGPRDPRQRREHRTGGVVEDITTALARAHTVQNVIDVMADTHILEHLGRSSMVLGLVEAGRVRIVASTPADEFVPGTEVTRIDEPYPMSTVVRTLSPLYIESPEEFALAYPELWSSVRPLGVTGAAYLPLVAQAQCIGAVGLLFHGKDTFSGADRDVLIALASSVAQNLRRAMFYDQAKDLAQGLQQAMLPHNIPEVPGADVAVRYRSAALTREIGGDWYDLIPLPGGRYGAVIGDVEGHDTHAAAVMGQLRIVLRAYASEGHTPATVMARASVFLHELDTERFATCLYAEADLTTGVVQVVRAGHLAPLIRQLDGSCRLLEVDGGLPLGHAEEFGAPEYDVTAVELEPGQTLLLFTDGLVELPDTDLDDGVAALAEQVRTGPHDLQQLADQLCEVVGERGGEDDVALLLLHRHGQYPDRPTVPLRRDVAPGDPESLAGVRHMIRAAGKVLGAGERSDEIELVADEMITNVLVHTEGPATVTIRLLPGRDNRLRVEVEDASSALPRRREAGESGVTGRGLLLVDRLADVWGVEPRGSGKCVWSEFSVPRDA